MSRPATDETHFCNVDLDVWSRKSLAPLVAALERLGLVTLFAGRERSRYAAHFEGAGVTDTPEQAFLRLVAAVRKLRGEAKARWLGATRREFNIGVDCGLRPPSPEIVISRRVLEAVASVQGAIVVTSYAPGRARGLRSIRNAGSLKR